MHNDSLRSLSFFRLVAFIKCVKYYLRNEYLRVKTMALKLSEIADIQAGHPFRGKITEDRHSQDSVVQMKDVSPDGSLGQLNWHNLVTARLEGRKSPVWLRPGHVLFVARGGRNFAVHVNEAPMRAVCGQLFFLINVKKGYEDKVLPRFVAWLINSTKAQRYFDADAQGVTQSYAQRNITRKVLEDLPIVLPSMDEQLKMTQLFETARRERATLMALIDNRQNELSAITTEFYLKHAKHK
jgi:hypothetical protein